MNIKANLFCKHAISRTTVLNVLQFIYQIFYLLKLDHHKIFHHFFINLQYCLSVTRCVCGQPTREISNMKEFKMCKESNLRLQSTHEDVQAYFLYLFNKPPNNANKLVFLHWTIGKGLCQQTIFERCDRVLEVFINL